MIESRFEMPVDIDTYWLILVDMNYASPIRLKPVNIAHIDK